MICSNLSDRRQNERDFESMGIDSGIVIIVLLILTIILLINVVSSNMRLSRLERKYKMFMRGGDAQSLEKFCKKICTDRSAV